MSSRCPNCKGRGQIIKDKANCSTCFGMGKTTIVLGEKGGEACKTCNGTGKITTYEKCSMCNGTKVVSYCKNCKKLMGSKSKTGLCSSCQNQTDPIVYVLKPPVDGQLVRRDMLLLSRVENVKNIGVFVKLADGVNVLIGSKDLTRDYAWDIGEEVIVRIKSINEQGKLYGAAESLKKYKLESLRGKVRTLQIADITPERVGAYMSFKAQVVAVLQTSGPTRFTFVDKTGSINGAAFIKPGERAFADIKEDSVVQVFGEVTKFKETMQIEIRDIELLEESEAKSLVEEIENAIDEKSIPPDIEFSIKSPTLERLKEDIKEAAKIIRKAVYTGQTIYIRHHADADGGVAGFCMHYALEKFMEAEGFDSDTIRMRIKRLPNKPPFFELIDTVKDIEFSLADKERFGDKLPIFVCMDFGSSTESLLSYQKLKALDLTIVVIDHHFPDQIIKELVDVHVNPYWVEGGYELSGGMLGFEVAKFIYPGIATDLEHLPAVAGLMDRVEGEEIKAYLELAKQKGYEKEKLEKIGIALDFEMYFLRFSEGKNLMKILFNVDTEQTWHEKMVELVWNEAFNSLQQSLKDSLPHVEHKTLENKIELFLFDVEMYTHRFSFPPPGKLTGLVFDHYCKENENKAVVTLGLGPDFLILRSKNVSINFPDMIKKMREKIPETGTQGGGHEVVGSLKFYEGEREKAINFFVDLLSTLKTI